MPATPIVLIVDDTASAREALEGALLQGGYQLVFAEDGPTALAKAAANPPDLVLLDVMMPDMDGFEVCRRLRDDPVLSEIPVIMITALDDRDSRIKGIDAGADDFLSKPFDRLELRARVKTVVRLNRYRRLLGERAKVERLVTLSPDGILVVDGGGFIRVANEAVQRLLEVKAPSALVGQSAWSFLDGDARDAFATSVVGVMTDRLPGVRLETQFRTGNGRAFPAEVSVGYCDWDDQPSCELVIRDITERKRDEAEIVRLNDELLESYDATLEGWVRALDLRDRETEGHTQRVTKITVRLAKAVGIPDDEIVNIRRGALLHDIGKMGVPDAILWKPGPLDDDERHVIEQHPTFAFNMLSHIKFLQPALDIPHHHHEKWDGSGYPDGLKGEDISIAARLFAVVDVCDALTSDRPYRKGWSTERVREHILSLSGTHFDPWVVDEFLKLKTTGAVEPSVRSNE